MSRPLGFASLAALALFAGGAALGRAGTVATATVKPAATTRLALPFIDDDLPRAMSQAKARKLPIFVESWAPW